MKMNKHGIHSSPALARIVILFALVSLHCAPVSAAPPEEQITINIYRTLGPAAFSRSSVPTFPPAARIVASSARDASPHVSRDGKKVVFSSNRTGAWEVWTCDSNGKSPFQVTHLGNTPTGSTRWSPDGRRIAFDGQKPDHYDVYVVNADGSSLRQLTSETSRDIKPSWSNDGLWVYFTSNRTGNYQVWKIPADGGAMVQVTRNGGYTPFESLDGKYVYYSKSLDDHSIWRVPVNGGQETKVLDDVVSNRWVIISSGICILNMDAKPRPVIEFFDFATQRRTPLPILPAQGTIYGGGTAIAAPPDGRFLLFGQVDEDRKTESVEYAGLSGPVGAPPGSKTVKMLRIDKPGVYENIIVDGEFGDSDLVRIRTDNVVLRNCTIRYGLRDAVEVYGRNIRIENCKIHHVLASTFQDQKDAHGITGRPLNLTIRNTEIAYVSGDAIQFDPSRKLEPYPWDNVLVDHCFLWTGPLDKDYAGFKKGERPGENAFDSKTHPDQPRGRITMRNCLMKGWGHGQINNGAALNLKEKIQAVIDKCVFVENDIAYRCRGTKGAAWVTTRNCTVYQTSRVFRPEYKVPNLKIFYMAYGEGVEQKFDNSGGGHGEGFVDYGTRQAPPLAAWPYDRLPVGEIIAPGNPPSSADDAIPTKIATGWEGNP